MIELLVTVLIVALICGLIFWIIQSLPIAEPFGTIAKVAVAVICVIVLLGLLFGGVSLPRFR